MDLFNYENIFEKYEREDGYSFYDLSNSVNIDGELDISLYKEDYIYHFSDWYNLSYKHYGTVKLWWMILVANKIHNPFDFYSGQKIKILKKEVVSEVISQINNS